MAAMTFLMLVRTSERRLELCMRRFSPWRARFFACGEFATCKPSLETEIQEARLFTFDGPLSTANSRDKQGLRRTSFYAILMAISHYFFAQTVETP